MDVEPGNPNAQSAARRLGTSSSIAALTDHNKKDEKNDDGGASSVSKRIRNTVSKAVRSTGGTATAAAVTVVLVSLILAVVFALIRIPYMSCSDHFLVNNNATRRPILMSFIHSVSIQVFIGPILVTPVSTGMQALYLAQLVISFIVNSGLFMILASHFDSTLFNVSET